MSDDKPTFTSIRISTRKKLEAFSENDESYDEILNRLISQIEKMSRKWKKAHGYTSKRRKNTKTVKA